MPKILKQGTKKEAPWQGTCHTCGSQIEYSKSELSGYCILHDRDGSLCEVDCPSCGKRLWVYPVRSRG